MNTKLDNIIEQAINYGIAANNSTRNVMAIQIALFWLEGYIHGFMRASNENLSNEDITQLYYKIHNYKFE